MTSVGVPDLLTSGQLARAVNRTTTDLTRVTEELTTGQTTDIVEATGGDPSRLFQIDRELAANAALFQTIDLAAGRSEVTQSALQNIELALEPFGAGLIASAEIGDIRSSVRRGAAAESAFADVIASLNSRFGDRSLFAGAAVDGAAMADADTILNELRARTAGAADASAAIAAIDDFFFNDPAGFDTVAYAGSTTDAPPAALGGGAEVVYAIRADEQAIRQTLAGIAMVVIGSEGAFAGATTNGQLAVLQEAGDRSIAATERVIDLRSRLGVAEERIEDARVSAEAERTLFSTARNNIVQKDEFETATLFTALETQLQKVFSVTARLNQLTILNFLR